MKHVTKTLAGIAAVLLAAAATTAQAGPLLVAGSPEYDEATGNGFKGGEIVFPGSGVNNSGVAVGYAYCYEQGVEKGNRAVRWDGLGTGAVELGNLDMPSGSVSSAAACAINDAGTAVGSAIKYIDGTDKGDRAVRWDASDIVATELGNLGGASDGYTHTWAYALNDAGTAVGTAAKYVDDALQGTRAVRWDAGGTAATELDSLGTTSGGYTEVHAYAVNNVGTAVGDANRYVEGVGKGDRAVRWDAGTTIATELGNLGVDSNGYTYAKANAINEAGTAVGYARKHVDGVVKGDRAVRWEASGTAATELGNLGTSSSSYTAAQAYVINHTGTAVGYARKYVDGTHKGNRAVRWDAGTTIATELGNLGTDVSGVTDAKAYDVNEAGTAVGYSEKYIEGVNVGSRAVMWLPDACAIDLNDLGVTPVTGSGSWTLNIAKALSADGWVAGKGTYDPDGNGDLESYERLWVAQVGVGGRWTTAGGGTWGRGPNWSSGTPAMQVGHATFDLDADYTVTLDRDELTKTIDVAAGIVSFDLASHILSTESGLSIAQDATLKAAGTLMTDIVNAGTLEFDISGSADYGAINLIGQFTAGGRIVVKLLDGYSPTVGSEFGLMSFDTFVDDGYEFDFTGATLSAGLTWDTSSFATIGTIRVVPEPDMATMATLVLGLLAGIRRRRSRTSSASTPMSSFAQRRHPINKKHPQ